jgi:hypothetical protein
MGQCSGAEGRQDARCAHVTSLDSVYLRPIRPKTQNTEARRYCEQCGLVEEGGGRPAEHFVNLLFALNRHISARKHLGIRPLAEVERRVIIQALRTQPVFTDPYGSTYTHQVACFRSLLSTHRNIPEGVWDDLRP